MSDFNSRKKSFNILNEYSKAVNQTRTDNSMTDNSRTDNSRTDNSMTDNSPREQGHTMINKTLHKKLKIEQN